MRSERHEEEPLEHRPPPPVFAVPLLPSFPAPPPRQLPVAERRGEEPLEHRPRAQPPLRPPPRLSIAAAARAPPDGSPSSLPAPRLPVTRVSSRWPRPAGHRSLADAPSSPLHTLARSPCRAGPAAPSPASDDSPRPPSSCVSLLCSLAWAAAAARPVVASQPRLCSETRIVKVIFENFRQVPRHSEPLGNVKFDYKTSNVYRYRRPNFYERCTTTNMYGYMMTRQDLEPLPSREQLLPLPSPREQLLPLPTPCTTTSDDVP